MARVARGDNYDEAFDRGEGYPVTLSGIDPTPVTATYDAATRSVTLVDAPGADFVWQVEIEGVWTSPAVPTVTRTQVIPENVGDVISFVVTCTSLDKTSIGGMPGVLVRSAPVTP